MFSIEKIQLNQVEISEIVDTLNNGLSKLYDHCKCDYVDCPDLRQSPFNLVESGIGSNRSFIVDCGSVNYLTPLVQRDKRYSFEQIAKIIANDYEDMKKFFIIGAAAGPFYRIGHNSELIPNISLAKNNDDNIEVIENGTYYADLINDNNEYRLCKCPYSEFGLLGNFYVSEGEPGKVIRIVLEKRLNLDGHHNESLTESIRKILNEKFPTKQISMGGVFLIENSQAKLHIMPDFSAEPLSTDNDVDNWLKYFSMNPPLVCLTTLHSNDLNRLDLRIEHTHCFNRLNGQGGHYHYDLQPNTVRYVAYLRPVDYVYRIDRPSKF